jgi:hypothetical protein
LIKLSKKSAYVLIVTLVMMFCSLLLLLSLSTYSQQAAIIASWSRGELYGQRIAQGVTIELEQQLTQDPTKAPTLTRYPLKDTPVAGTLEWGKSSQFQPFQPNAISGLFGDWISNPPPLGFSDASVAPPWAAKAVTSMPDKREYQTVLSTAFPYAAFAPWGSVQVSGEVSGFANPSFQDTFAQTNPAYPVRIAAGQDVSVTGAYGLGYAQSAEGKVTLPSGSGAIPLQGQAFPDPYTQTLHDQVAGSSGLISTFSSDLAVKTDFITGSELDPLGLYKLITGKEGLAAIFSVQQACSMPMPIFPNFIDGEAFDVILIYNPYPADFTSKGAKKSLGFIENILTDLLQSVLDLEASAVEAWKAVGQAQDAVWDVAKGIWHDITGRRHEAERDFEAAKEHYNQVKQDLQNALNDLKAAFDEFAKILNEVADAVKPTPPVTMEEEEEMATFGWAYFGILSRITQDLETFFYTLFGKTGWNELYATLMNETRVVHFVDRNPLGGFTEDGGFTLLATWTVPRGRTLQIGNDQNPDYTIIGDLWIQRGATLRVQGSLFVEAPSAASEEGKDSKDEDDDGKAWDYEPESGMTSTIIPTGTIYLEPGATLVVDGVLYAEGDSAHGSINICSPAGVTTPLSTAIFCQGDVQLPNGTGSGLTVANMLRYIGDTLGYGGLKGLVDDFFIPVLIDLPPQLAKLDGPFHARKCWFSEYAVSLVIIPELAEFGLQGPWPIPLPYKNCWTNIFNPLTEIYQVELNFALGENLFTHSDWWIFGQGVVPVVPKVDPQSYAAATEEAFAEFSSGDLNPESVLSTIGTHLDQVIPKFAEAVLKEAIIAVLEDIVESEADAFEDPCAKQEDGEEQEEEDKLKEQAEDFGKEMVQKFASKMEKMFGTILSEYRDTVAKNVNSGLSAEAGEAKELPGVFLYCGGQLDIGSEIPAKASGFFFAEGDVNIYAGQTFGSVVSRTGSVKVVGDLLYYPYYSRASLWNPQRPDTYGVNTSSVPSYFKEFVDVFQAGLYLETPENGKPVPVGVGGVVKLAEGYQ